MSHEFLIPHSSFLIPNSFDDQQFLREDEIYKVPMTACALANSSGGYIIIGAELDSDGEINITGINSSININSLIPREISFDTEYKGRVLVVRVLPLEFYKRPVFFEGKLFRRVENENLISSRRSAAIMAASSEEYDDETANLYIDPGSLNNFYDTVTKIHAPYKNLEPGEFLSRSFIFSGKYLTFAGALMFGNIIKVSAVLNYGSEHVKLIENNIWDAYKNILPRLVNKLSMRCSQAFQEIFINALLHADYKIDNSIEILITCDPSPRVFIKNPGIIINKTRNKRLSKIFSLSGMTRAGRNLEAVKKYMPVKLEQDMLNFSVTASLELEGVDLNTKSPVIL